MNYEVRRLDSPPIADGVFIFAAAGLEHGHIYGMTQGLLDAGAVLKWAWDIDGYKLDTFCSKYPQVKRARCLDEILEDTSIRLVASAAIPSKRCELGIRVMESGKDYFTDKPPLTSLRQLEDAKAVCARTGRRYFCYYSERLHSESGAFAGELIREGAIGRVVQVLGLGPHRLSPESRPDWFFDKERYGGILCDIGSHQAEQFLYYTGTQDAKVAYSRTGNFAHPQYPGLEDFGEASLISDNGASGYFRVDWFTPDGLSSWGDGRTVLLGTEGYIEMRKYVNVACDKGGDHVFLVDKSGEHYFNVRGRIGYPFFGNMIHDSLYGTESAMTQKHIFKAAELCLKAQFQSTCVVNSTEGHK